MVWELQRFQQQNWPTASLEVAGIGANLHVAYYDLV